MQRFLILAISTLLAASGCGNDIGSGASYATIEVYLDGVLEFAQRDKSMTNRADFWRVAAIDWPSGRVTSIDMTSDGFP